MADKNIQDGKMDNPEQYKTEKKVYLTSMKVRRM